MAGLGREPDPEPAARRLVRSATSSAPPQQRPPRAPPSARHQPPFPMIAGSLAKQAPGTPEGPYPFTAPPPRALAWPKSCPPMLHRLPGYAPAARALPARRPPPSTLQPQEVALQPPQQTRSEEEKPAAAGHKKMGEEKQQNSEEPPLRIMNRCEPNIGEPKDSILNPVEQEIVESVAAFATKDPSELGIIRDALLVLPKGPRSTLHHCTCEGGCGDACIQTQTRGRVGDHEDASSTSAKVLSFDIGPELAEFGRILSNPWRIIWEREPLILHDAEIVRAAKAIGVRFDLSQRITAILQNHPGPVRYFRIDSAIIENGSEQLEVWFELLKEKQVQEVVFVNCGWPSEMIELPLRDLDCESVKRMRLCFVKISGICLNYVKNLTVIDLSGCSINSQDLYALVCQCTNLKELDLGLYEGDIIRINSGTLEILLIWNSTVRTVAVKNAAKLQRVLVAAKPKKSSSPVEIWIQDAPMLRDAWFNLSTQSVTINNISTMMDNAPMPSLRRLVLHMSFGVKKERKALLNLMKSCTTLKELTVWRNDEASSDEYLDAILDDWPEKFKNLSCVKKHLQVFAIKDYKGGENEVAIASAVLRNAGCLQLLILEADGNVHDDVIFSRAKTELKKVIQASASVNADVKCQLGLGDCDSFFLSD
ncbi:hypothetical protein ACP70R_020415 [Stipagrostis hirtigluma subsp. patula]